MFVCPRCDNSALAATRSHQGVVWACPSCRGVALTGKVLRNIFAKDTVRRLEGDIVDPFQSEVAGCPACHREMAEIRAEAADEGLHLDRCPSCDIWWFDRGEFTSVPRAPKRSLGYLRQHRRAERLKASAERSTQRAGSADPPPARVGLVLPDRGWKILATIAGMPAEINAPRVHRPPLVTWSLAAAIFGISLAAFLHGGTAFEALGLIPDQVARLWGFTFFTSFFLHGGWVHLLGNLYFLIVFGDNVEDVLGRLRFTMLVAIAALAGSLLHCVLDPQSSVPLIGASGGISAVILFYALAFPRVGISIFLRIWWIQIPAWSALVVWLGMQFLATATQLQGVGNVSALAHLGGAAVGFLFWLATQLQTSDEVVRHR